MEMNGGNSGRHGDVMKAPDGSISAAEPRYIFKLDIYFHDF